MPQLDRLWYTISAETQGFDEGVLKAGDKLKQFTEYAKGQPLAVLGALGAAAVVAGVKLAEMAGELEQQMAKVQTVAKVSTQELAKLRQGVLDVFTDLPVESVDDLTGALYNIVSSGVPAAHALDFLRTAAVAAVADGSRVTDVVEGMTGAFNAYAAQGKSAAEISDVMFATVAAGRGEFADLAASIGNVTGVSAQLGLSFEEVNATLAQASLTLPSFAESVTGLRSAITNILRPTEEFKKQFPELAASFTEGRLRGDGFVKFLLDFQQAAGGNSRAIQGLFSDVQAFAFVQTLLAQNGKGVVAMLDQTTHSAGATAAAAKEMTQTAKATNQELKNELHRTLLEGGEKLLPAYSAGLNGTIAVLDLLTGAAGNSAGAIRRLNQAVRDYHTPNTEQVPGNVLGGRRLTASTANTPAELEREEARRITDEVLRLQGALDKLDPKALRDVQVILEKREATGTRSNDEVRALQAVREELLRRAKLDREAEVAAQRKAAEQSKTDADAVRGARAAGDAAAEEAKHYAGAASTVATAARQRTAALGAITEAQGKLADADAKAQAAAARGDVAGVNAAKKQAEAARAVIDANSATAKEAGEVLRQHANQVGDSIRSLAASVADSLANGTETGVDDALASLQRYEAQVAKLEREVGHALPDLRAKGQTLRDTVDVTEGRERRVAQRNVDTVLADASGTQVAGMQLALRDLLADIDKANAAYARMGKAPLVTPEQRERIASVRQALVDATGAAEDYDRALQAMADADAARERDRAQAATGVTTTDPVRRQRELSALAREQAEDEARQAAGRLQALKAQETALRTSLALVPKGKDYDAARQVINGKIAEVLREQARLYGVIVQGADAAADAERERRDHIAKLTQDVTGLASSILSAANGMGLLSDRSASALQSVVGIGEGIGRAFSGDIIGGVMQTLESVGGLVGSLSQRRQIDAAREETLSAMRSLTNALLDLRDVQLQNVSTQQAQSDQDFITRALAATHDEGPVGHQRIHLSNGDVVLRDGEGNGPGRRENLARFAESIGIKDTNGNDTRDELRQRLAGIDSRYGTSLAGFVDRDAPEGLIKALRLLPDAMKDAIGNLGTYGHDAADIIERVAFEFDVLGKTDPAAKFRATIAALKNAGVAFGEFADEFAQLTAEGLTTEQRDAVVGQVLDRLGQAGPLDFGALTPEQLRDLLKQAAGVDDGATPGADAPGVEGTGGFNVDRTITETTGTRVAGLLGTANVFAARTAAATEAMARELTHGAFGGDTSATAATDAALAILASLQTTPAPAPVAPPALPVGGLLATKAPRDAGGPLMPGSIDVSLAPGAVVVQLSGAAASDPQRVGEAVTDAMLDTLVQQLAARLQFAAFAQGVVPSTRAY